MKAESTRCAFTLIELLAVVAIIAVLVMATLPAFDALKQRSSASAVPELATTLRLARQHAITHRQTVWVVFPDRSADYNPPGEVTKCLASYAVIVSNSACSNFEYVSDWKYLPKGVYFDDTLVGNSGVDKDKVFNSYARSGDDTVFPFPATNAPLRVRNMPAVMFKPNGRSYVYDPKAAAWTDFGETKALVSQAYVEVNTNTGVRPARQALPWAITNVVALRNATGQVIVE